MAFNNWFAQNPSSNPSYMGQTRWEAHVWGRQHFAKSFARGGFASTVFAQSRTEMLKSPWRMKAPKGTDQYLKNLRDLHKIHPQSKGIKNAISDVAKGKSKGMGTGLAAVGITAGIVAYAGLTTKGSIVEKARGATSAIGMEIGWAVGAKTGLGIGAAIGSAVPLVGTAIGGAIGWVGGGLIGTFAGGELAEGITRIPDRLVDSERSRRGLEWGNNIAPFQTQRAHTMRQQSLAAMNRGQMSARSLLGQEAVFVHR